MKLTALNDVCEIKNGYAFKSSDYKKTGVPLLRISSFNDGLVNLDGNDIHVDKEFLNTKRDFIVEKGDILIALSGATTGKYGIYNYDYPSLLNQRIGLLKSGTSEKINSKYFYFLLNILKKEILRKAGGAAQPNISTNKIGEIKIPLPPLAIQERIAEILDAADALRQKDQQLLAKYEQLSQSIFLDMFGDPVSNPKGWDIKEMKELTTQIGSGNTPKGGSQVYVKKGITFFRSQNVWRNRLEMDDVAYIDEETHKNMGKSSLKNGDILMTKTGRFNTENSSLGRSAMYEGEDDQANLNGHVYLIRPKKDILSKFILHILTTEQYRDYITRVCVGGIDKRQLNKNHLEEFPIIQPPIQLQNEFIQRLELIKQSIKQLENNLSRSEELFQALLQKSFKGELVNE